MSAEIESLMRDSTPDHVLSSLDRDGAVIVEGFVAPEKLSRLNRDIEKVLQNTMPGDPGGNETSQSFHGRHTKRFTRLAKHSPVFVDLMLDPLLATYADHFLRPSCSDYWLNTGQVMDIGPGEKAQLLHFDDDIWPELDL